jgi:streptomycin 3"-adenylyltransferase
VSAHTLLLDEVNSRSLIKVPLNVRRQVFRAVAAFRRILGGNLIGLYAHGSIATGGFTPRRSDLDLLALVHHRLPNAMKRVMIERMLAISGDPCPIEMSIVAREDIVTWRHPASFQLHWSEAWRERYRRQLGDGSWRRFHREHPRDGDLAAHIAMTRARGVSLFGPPPARAWPFVPVDDLLKSLVSDGRWARRLLRKKPAMARYAVLNACRRLAFLRRGFLLSKVEGAAWASRELPSRWRAVVAAARRGLPHPQVDKFLQFMAGQERSALAH